MRFTPTNCKTSGAKSQPAGFTLIEVLAALVFMAIVIPTAVEGVRIANLAGQVGQRKAVAARIGETALNELLVTHQWQSGSQMGMVQDGPLQYRWILRSQPWPQLNVLRLLTIEVSFPVQGQEHTVHLSTLVDP